ncbi:MAG: hypothetical protein WD404_09680 [Solirubrobacterales bacterium]
MAVVATGAIAWTGCGEDEGEATQEPASNPAPAYTPPPEVESRPESEPNQEPEPESDSTITQTEKQRIVRRDARYLCENSTPEEIASAYGGSVNDLPSLARAYAEGSTTEDVRDLAEAGCLEGLVGR